MATDQKNEYKLLLPQLFIHLLNGDIIKVGGIDNENNIEEVNFYSKLNSFAFNADITFEDSENKILNKLSEPNATKATIVIYSLPEDKNQELTQKDKVFQKSFSVESIDVLEFGKNVPYKSKLKISLTDLYDSLVFNKLVPFSNFNLDWDSDEMNVDSMIHRILKEYEHLVGKTIINEKIFGVDKQLLKRRFISCCNTTIIESFDKYLDSLYNTRWCEFLSNAGQQLDIPKCLLVYSNQYILDKDNILRQRPYITSLDKLDLIPDVPLYSIPYPKINNILNFAVKDYDIALEDTDIQFKGNVSGKEKGKKLAFVYKKSSFDPKHGLFENKIEWLKNIKQLASGDFNIESRQIPKYIGVGENPKFFQFGTFNEKFLSKYPFNLKENQYYYSNGTNSFYKDILDLLMKPNIFVSLPFSGWHSPGQEVDLRMSTMSQDLDKIEKDYFYSMNKIVSGRWKIINSVTNLSKSKNSSSSQFAFKPIETLGLFRTKYFSDDNPLEKDR